MSEKSGIFDTEDINYLIENMKFLHISDLHIGKRVLGFSMLEDQAYILNNVLEIAQEQQPQAVIIAGDVYDKGVPSIEAIDMFDNFLVSLSKMNLQVFVVSGNHDQAERLSFGSRLMIPNIHIAPAYKGAIKPIVLTDEYGEVNIYSLPFLKPSFVRQYSDEEIGSYQTAVDVAITQMNIDAAARNLLIAHQFVTNSGVDPELCESEETSVGGVDKIDATTFNAFDYVALGHLHRAQHVMRQSIRYSGSPLKYSFSEVNHKKSVTLLEIRGKGDIEINTIELTPKTDMSELKGTFDELTNKDFYIGQPYKTHYVRITLTDDEDIPNAFSRLRAIYPNLMEMRYDNKRTRSNTTINAENDIKTLQPIDVLKEFYQKQNGKDMDPEQIELANSLINKIWN